MVIRNVACVGAGLIGSGWATLFAGKGFAVTLQDLKRDALRRAIKEIRRNLEFLAKKGFLEENASEDSFKRIEITMDLKKAVEDADYVQESVSESYEVKKEVFKEIDAATSAHAILASSTSTLKMSVIQKVTRHPGRCIVVHPWNPPYLMPLVEVIPGEETSPETVEKTRRFMKSLGKVVVIQKKEVPGTIGNRLAAALWREAIDLVDKGVAELEDVDKAVSAGPGLRWAILGPHLSYHLGGGNGGIEHYLQHLGPAMESRWKSLAKWTSLSSSMKKRIIEGIKRSERARKKSLEELIRWRDEKLGNLLKVLYEEKM